MRGYGGLDYPCSMCNVKKISYNREIFYFYKKKLKNLKKHLQYYVKYAIIIIVSAVKTRQEVRPGYEICFEIVAGFSLTNAFLLILFWKVKQPSGVRRRWESA